MEFVKLVGPFAIFFIMYSLGLKLNFVNFYELLKSPKSLQDEATKNVEIIFHLAAFLGVDDVAKNPIQTMEVETIGTQNLIKSCVKNSVSKIIYTSTSGVYGKSAIQDAVNEDYEVAPSSSYAIAKRFNEIYLKSINEKYKIETFSLRTISLTSNNPDIAQDSRYPDTIPPLIIGFVQASP